MRHLTRKLATVAAAVSLGFGIVAISAPAHADSSWGYRVPPPSSH